ncbi:hypothetical protein N7524_012416 [Penicillium chrysogenum]|nr:hypothetical protein N7524_012416 [Penicillium chrysogenum]
MVGRRKNRAAAQPAVRTPSISTRSGRTVQEVGSHILKLKFSSFQLIQPPDFDDVPDGENENGTSAVSQNPETPRTRRPRHPRTVPESSRTTRQSARLKPDGDGAFEEDVSPTKVVDNQNNQPDDDMEYHQYNEEFKSEPPFEKVSQSPEPRTVASAPVSPGAKEKTEDTPAGQSPKISQIDEASFSAVSSPRISRKRKSLELQNGTPDVDSEDTISKKARTDEPETSPEDIPIPSEEFDPPCLRLNPVTKPRGGRGRGRAKATIIKRGKKIEDEIWDVAENWRGPTPEPTPESMPTKTRQEELSALFKKVGQAQSIALSVMADQTMHKLAREKNAHKECPEFEQVQRDLDEYERKAIEKLNAEYNATADKESRVYEAKVLIAKETARRRMEDLQDDMLKMLMGKMMALIQGRRVAEDDEHTEYDTSDSEQSVKQFLFRDGETAVRQEERGFTASAVRDPEGAVDYMAAEEGWEEFVQRVRLGRLNEEIAPAEITDEDALRTYAKDAFGSMLHAATYIHEQEASGKVVGYDGAADFPVHPRALSILADAALTEPVPQHLPMMRTDPGTHHRALLPPAHPRPPGPSSPPPSTATGQQTRGPSSSHGPPQPSSRGAFSPPVSSWVWGWACRTRLQ